MTTSVIRLAICSWINLTMSKSLKQASKCGSTQFWASCGWAAICAMATRTANCPSCLQVGSIQATTWPIWNRHKRTPFFNQSTWQQEINSCWSCCANSILSASRTARPARRRSAITFTWRATCQRLEKAGLWKILLRLLDPYMDNWNDLGYACQSPNESCFS